MTTERRHECCCQHTANNIHIIRVPSNPDMYNRECCCRHTANNIHIIRVPSNPTCITETCHQPRYHGCLECLRLRPREATTLRAHHLTPDPDITLGGNVRTVCSLYVYHHDPYFIVERSMAPNNLMGYALCSLQATTHPLSQGQSIRPNTWYMTNYLT